jgi:hypothetical protein
MAVLLHGQFVFQAIVPENSTLLFPTPNEGCSTTSGTLHAEQFAVRDESMRAETQNLVEEIKQSVRLLRRHL